MCALGEEHTKECDILSRRKEKKIIDDFTEPSKIYWVITTLRCLHWRKKSLKIYTKYYRLRATAGCLISLQICFLLLSFFFEKNSARQFIAEPFSMILPFSVLFFLLISKRWFKKCILILIFLAFFISCLTRRCGSRKICHYPAYDGPQQGVEIR